MSADWRDDFDDHCRPIPITALINILQQARERWPGCYVGRSGNGTGNINVYTADGARYVGVVELNDMLEGGVGLDDVAFAFDPKP